MVYPSTIILPVSVPKRKAYTYTRTITLTSRGCLLINFWERVRLRVCGVQVQLSSSEYHNHKSEQFHGECTTTATIYTHSTGETVHIQLNNQYYQHPLPCGEYLLRDAALALLHAALAITLIRHFASNHLSCTHTHTYSTRRRTKRIEVYAQVRACVYALYVCVCVCLQFTLFPLRTIFPSYFLFGTASGLLRIWA